jgi:hypothetical protein
MSPRSPLRGNDSLSDLLAYGGESTAPAPKWPSSVVRPTGAHARAQWRRIWLLALAAAELPLILAAFDATSLPTLTGLASNLCNGTTATHCDPRPHAAASAGAEARLWALVRCLLVLARLAGAAAPHSRLALAHCAAAHAAEAAILGSEALWHGAAGAPPLLLAMVLHVALLAAAALHAPMLTGDGGTALPERGGHRPPVAWDASRGFAWDASACDPALAASADSPLRVQARRGR